MRWGSVCGEYQVICEMFTNKSYVLFLEMGGSVCEGLRVTYCGTSIEI